MSFIVIFPLIPLLGRRKSEQLCQFPILLRNDYYSIKFKGRDLPVHTLITIRLTHLSHAQQRLCH